MHMADALLSPAVGVTMCAVSAAAVGYSAVRVHKDELGESKLPLMAVAGAFVFAAQMINFTIPATGSSGHLGGGILLAALLGGAPAFLAIAAVLIIQCLFFADGGLLALGCNLFNMGVIPCLIVYPLVFRPILRGSANKGRISLAAIVSSVLALQLGAFGVVLETLASGVTALPFTTFAALMQPIHLAIGLVEGLVTAAILCVVAQMRPEILTNAETHGGSMKRVLIVLAVATLLVGGGLSLVASTNPDGLEWAVERTAGTAELPAQGAVFDRAAEIQENTAILPDYDYKTAGEEGSETGVTVAGIVGSIFTFVLAGAVGFILTKVRKKRTTQ